MNGPGTQKARLEIEQRENDERREHRATAEQRRADAATHRNRLLGLAFFLAVVGVAQLAVGATSEEDAVFYHTTSGVSFPLRLFSPHARTQSETRSRGGRLCVSLP